MSDHLHELVEAHCRQAFGSWDGYRGVGGVWQQYFTEEMREYFRAKFRPFVEREARQ